MKLIELRPSPNPAPFAWWQVHVLGLRVHHGAAGALLTAASVIPLASPRRVALAAIGAALMIHDRADRPWYPWL